jgi:hypothetical protein
MGLTEEHVGIRLGGNRSGIMSEGAKGDLTFDFKVPFEDWHELGQAQVHVGGSDSLSKPVSADIAQHPDRSRISLQPGWEVAVANEAQQQVFKGSGTWLLVAPPAVCVSDDKLQNFSTTGQRHFGINLSDLNGFEYPLPKLLEFVREPLEYTKDCCQRGLHRGVSHRCCRLSCPRHMKLSAELTADTKSS